MAVKDAPRKAPLWSNGKPGMPLVGELVGHDLSRDMTLLDFAVVAILAVVP